MGQYPTYLIHYGIQGQKWGVRRFQNEDGTWTDEGLARRYRLSEKKANKLAKTYEKNPEKFSKAVSKLKAVKAYKTDNPYEQEYSAKTRKKWVTDQKTKTEATIAGNAKKLAMRKNNSDFLIGKSKKIYSDDEIQKEYEKTITKYLTSDAVNKKYKDLDKELNSSYNAYANRSRQFANSILEEYGNIKLSDGKILSDKVTEELLKNKRGKAYVAPENLKARPSGGKVLSDIKRKEEVDEFRRRTEEDRRRRGY